MKKTNKKKKTLVKGVAGWEWDVFQVDILSPFSLFSPYFTNLSFKMSYLRAEIVTLFTLPTLAPAEWIVVSTFTAEHETW